MIERSGTEASPELDQFNREMMNKMGNKMKLGLDLNKLGRFWEDYSDDSNYKLMALY